MESYGTVNKDSISLKLLLEQGGHSKSTFVEEGRGAHWKVNKNEHGKGGTLFEVSGMKKTLHFV